MNFIASLKLQQATYCQLLCTTKKTAKVFLSDGKATMKNSHFTLNDFLFTKNVLLQKCTAKIIKMPEPNSPTNCFSMFTG